MDISDTPYAFAPEKTREIIYLFLQDVWTINDSLELTAGARYDDYSDFGDTLNPRLAMVWKNSNQLTTKLMYGQTFRAPSYQELFAETSHSLPNAKLDPERSQTLELAFSYIATKNLHLNLNLYHLEQTNIIRAIEVAGLPINQFQNAGDHTIQGIELEAQWQATKDLRISGNYSIHDQDDDEFRTIQEADQNAYLRLDWGLHPQWNWNLQSNWTGERPRASGDTRLPLSDNLITDTTLRFAGSENWEFAGSVRNVFDVDAREYMGQAVPNDLPLPERNFYAEMRYKF